MKILYFSHISWQWIKQRPQFLAEALALSGHEVVYLFREPFGTDSGIPPSPPCPRLTVRRVSVLPGSLRCPLIGFLNSRFLRRTIAWDAFDAIVLSDPRLADAVPPETAAPVIYDCMDYHAAFHTGAIRRHVTRKERELCRRADHVIVSSNALHGRLCREYGLAEDRVSVIRNAIPAAFLERYIDAGKNPETEIPCLYVGTVDFWFDWETVLAFAHAHPELEIHIAGPLLHRPAQLPLNIVTHGPVPNGQIPGLLRRARILLMPFLKNDLVSCVDPVKLYEYLACGKPVLSSFWPELEFFAGTGRLFFYRTQEEFSGTAERLLKGAPGAAAEADARFAAENTWEKRAAEYLAVLGIYL